MDSKGNLHVSVEEDRRTDTGRGGSERHRVFSWATSKRFLVIAGAIVSCGFTIGFLLLFWNKFAGFRSGDGLFTAATELLSGFLPYRDYYVPITPLSIFEYAALLKLFGNFVIVLRVFAVVERALLGLVLYAWLVRLFRVRDAAFATVVTMIVSACDLTEPVSSYNHNTIFLGVISGFVASFVFREAQSRRATFLTGFLSGAFAAFSFCSKQSIGLAILLAVPVIVAVCLCRRSDFRRTVWFLSGFASGTVAVLIALMLWLGHLGLFGDFIQQVFVKGPAAKASKPSDFVFRWFSVAVDMLPAVLLALLALSLSLVPMLHSGEDNSSEDESRKHFFLEVLLCTAAIAIGISFTAPVDSLQPRLQRLAVQGVQQFVASGLTIDKAMIYFALFSSGLVGLYYLAKCFRSQLSWRESQYLLLSAVSFSCAVMLSLSWPAFEAMVVPSLGLPIAAVLDQCKNFRRGAVIAVCLVVLAALTYHKVRVPFGFLGWNELPTQSARFSSRVPELKGLALPESDVQFIDSTVDIIRNNTSPNDTIFTYPEMAIFYGISHRHPPTFSFSHNYDVMPDVVARNEAERLRTAPPKVIIYGPESEAEIRDLEENWRDRVGNSGQRDIIANVEQLAKGYRLAGRFRICYGQRPVFVFVRPQ